MKDRKSGAAAGIHAHTIARENLQIFGHRLGVIHIRLGHRIAGDQPVNLALGDVRIGHGPARGIDAQPRRAELRQLAHRGVRGPNDGDFSAQAFQGQFRSGLVEGNCGCAWGDDIARFVLDENFKLGGALVMVDRKDMAAGRYRFPNKGGLAV